MRKYIFLMITFFSLPFLYTDVKASSLTVVIDEQQDVLEALDFMRFIAQLSNDSIMLRDFDTMPIDHLMQKYAQLCWMVHQSLTHIKRMYTSRDCSKMHNLLYRTDITMNLLLAMQRNNRQCIKNIIEELRTVPNSDYLQASLQELYHNLHEVKKQIVDVHQDYIVHAQYLYAMLLFLSMILQQGIQEIKKADHHSQQQIMMQQLFYCIERFKQNIVSDGMNKRGSYEKN